MPSVFTACKVHASVRSSSKFFRRPASLKTGVGTVNAVKNTRPHSLGLSTARPLHLRSPRPKSFTPAKLLGLLALSFAYQAPPSSSCFATRTETTTTRQCDAGRVVSRQSCFVGGVSVGGTCRGAVYHGGVLVVRGKGVGGKGCVGLTLQGFQEGVSRGRVASMLLQNPDGCRWVSFFFIIVAI